MNMKVISGVGVVSGVGVNYLLFHSGLLAMRELWGVEVIESMSRSPTVIFLSCARRLITVLRVSELLVLGS